MGNVFLFIPEEKVDGTSFNLKDTSTGWGDDYAKVNVTSGVLYITSQFNDALELALAAAGNLVNFFSDDGLDITPADLGLTEDRFADGWYEFRIALVIDIAPLTDTYTIPDGFVAEHHSRSMQFATEIEWPQYDPAKEKDKVIANVLLDGAKYAAALAEYTNFQYLIDKIDSIYEHYNIDALW